MLFAGVCLVLQSAIIHNLWKLLSLFLKQRHFFSLLKSVQNNFVFFVRDIFPVLFHFCMSVCLCLCFCLWLSLCLSISLSHSLSLSVCLYHCYLSFKYLILTVSFVVAVCLYFLFLFFTSFSSNLFLFFSCRAVSKICLNELKNCSSSKNYFLLLVRYDYYLLCCHFVTLFVTLLLFVVYLKWVLWKQWLKLTLSSKL